MIYDYKTKNASFMKVHKKLQAEHIKNNDFMLELHNPRVADIDPYDILNLSNIDITDIITECQKNFWYFMREIARWPNPDSPFPTKAKLEIGNAAVNWLSLNDINSWRSNIRQSCSDINIHTFLLWKLLFAPNSNSRIISGMGFRYAEQIQSIFKLYELLPSYLWIDNLTREISMSVNYNVGTFNNPKISSDLDQVQASRFSLRGDKSNILFFHQAEYTQDIEEVIHSASGLALHIFNSGYGEPYTNSTIFSELLIEGMTKWKNSFYDCPIDELKEGIKRFGNNVIYIKQTYSELDFSEEWAKELRSLMTPTNYAREILLLRAGNDLNGINERYGASDRYSMIRNALHCNE